MSTQPDDPTTDLAATITLAVLAASSDAALARLQRLLDAGADVHAQDERGSNAITRFALDARQVVPAGFDDVTVPGHLRLVAEALLARGADPDLIDARWGQSVRERLGTSAVADLLQPIVCRKRAATGAAVAPPEAPTST